MDKDAKDIKIREDLSGVVVNVKETITRSNEELLSEMRKGNKNRKVAETHCNERSSRSHSIFKIVIIY